MAYLLQETIVIDFKLKIPLDYSHTEEFCFKLLFY